MFTKAAIFSALALLSLPGLTSAAPADSASVKRQAGTTLFPHYLIPVQPSQPDNAFGSVYTPQIVSGQAVDVAFDVPSNGATCDLYFYLPGTGSNPGNGVSSYSLTGSAQFTAQQLSGPVSTGTTWNNRPAAFGNVYSFTLKEGQSTFIASVGCGQGQQQGFEFSAVGDASVKWFESSAAPAVGIVLVQH